MTEDAEHPPAHVEGRKYAAGERVTFRGQVYEAMHQTVVRPRLTKSWRLVEEPAP